MLAVYGLVVLPLLVSGYRLYEAHRLGNFALDFDGTLLPAAEAIASGDSPYPAFGYPPLVAFLLVPFTFLPAPDVLFTGLLVGSVPLSLWLLGIRDWRCYGAAFAWAPVFHALQTANVTILLLVGVAACWRLRERPVAMGLAGGLAVAAKGICWPLALWAVATRRLRAAGVIVAVCLCVTFGLWATLGFSGLSGYPSNVDRLEGSIWRDTYTLRALALDLGASDLVALGLGSGLAVAALAACLIFGIRGDDRRSFACAVAAIIIASPLVWLHSFALLLAPLAVLRPRFSGIWLLPVLLWLASGTGNGETWQTALVLAVGAAVFLVAVSAQVSSGNATGRSGTSGLRRLRPLGVSSSKTEVSTKPSL